MGILGKTCICVHSQCNTLEALQSNYKLIFTEVMMQPALNMWI